MQPMLALILEPVKDRIRKVRVRVEAGVKFAENNGFYAAPIQK